uniref:butyrophilin-like protein 9 n=1 Tax=Pristiophorus japonicus TaxID=55135 RepID=UPI00398E703A
MNLPHRNHQFLPELVCLLSSVCHGLVTLARVGDIVILDCRFPTGPSPGLIVEWSLRQPLRVVYSYYSGSAQAASQHPQFRDRATVDQSRLALGEAALRLSDVTPQDQGLYRCFIRLALAKHETWQRLEVAGPYSEPQVTCFMLDLRHEDLTVNMSCRSEGGFPRAEARWRWDNGSWYRGRSQKLWSQAPDGSFDLQSLVEIPGGQASQLRCVVINGRLNQTLTSPEMCRRDPIIDSDSWPSNATTCLGNCQPQRGSEQVARIRLGFIGSAVVLSLSIALLLYFQTRCRYPRSEQRRQPRGEGPPTDRQ